MPTKAMPVPFPIKANLIPMDMVKAVYGKKYDKVSSPAYELVPQYVISNGPNTGTWVLLKTGTTELILASEVMAVDIIPLDGTKLIYGKSSDSGIDDRMVWDLVTLEETNDGRHTDE